VGIGLYHGKDIRFGNSISHSHTKSKRSWHPNVFKKRLWSFAFDDWVSSSGREDVTCFSNLTVCDMVGSIQYDRHRNEED
jgi:hypothetical protein